MSALRIEIRQCSWWSLLLDTVDWNFILYKALPPAAGTLYAKDYHVSTLSDLVYPPTA